MPMSTSDLQVFFYQQIILEQCDYATCGDLVGWHLLMPPHQALCCVQTGMTSGILLYWECSGPSERFNATNVDNAFLEGIYHSHSQSGHFLGVFQNQFPTWQEPLASDSSEYSGNGIAEHCCWHIPHISLIWVLSHLLISFNFLHWCPPDNFLVLHCHIPIRSCHIGFPHYSFQQIQGKTQSVLGSEHSECGCQSSTDQPLSHGVWCSMHGLHSWHADDPLEYNEVWVGNHQKLLNSWGRNETPLVLHRSHAQCICVSDNRKHRSE